MTSLPKELYLKDYEDERAKRGIPFGFCFCGCGQKAPISTRDGRRWKDVKGHPRRFVQYHHSRYFCYASNIDKTVYSENGVPFCLVPLTRGLFARVSPHRLEYILQWKWYAIWAPNTGTFYAMRKGIARDGRRISISMQREILGLDEDDKRQGDHIDRTQTLNNTDENLRIATTGEQQCNKRLNRRNTTGYRGVSLRKDNGMYRALIAVNGKKQNLGQRAIAEEAARLYDEAARKLHGRFATLNFPDQATNQGCSTVLRADSNGSKL